LSKETELLRLNENLTAIELSISNIEKSGQSVKKGNFSVEFAKLPNLYARADILRAKITAWEAS